MSSSWISRVTSVCLLVGVTLAAACGGAKPEGTYRDTNGTVTIELKDGKASMNMGPVHLDGTYTVDGDKLTIRPAQGDTAQTVVFAINKDGSLGSPEGADIPTLRKTS